VRWIIGSGKDITSDNNQLSSRRNFINLLTNADVSEWKYLKVNGRVFKDFLCCVSFDCTDGTFITAHMQNNNFPFLFSLHEVNKGNFVVANTCVLEKPFDTNLLYTLMSYNRNIELFFAKQELTIASNRLFFHTNTINNFGEFGFQTSLSEREMFKNRKKGLINSIRESFDRVSPILSSNDVK
jgi:hypothetical protein